MKERLKSFLLFFLVGISLIFTRDTWIEIPSGLLEVFKTDSTAYSVSYLLTDMLSPSKYLINFNDKYHTVLNGEKEDNLWTSATSILSSSLKEKDLNIDIIDDDDFQLLNNERSIVFYYPEKINTYILSKIIGIDKPNSVVDRISNIDSIYISLGDQDPYFILSNEKDHYKISQKNMNTAILRQNILMIEKEKDYNYYDSMGKRLGIENNIFIPYEMNSSLPRVFVVNKMVNFSEEEKRQLVEKFFSKNIDYIREIVESNGSVIYVYNGKVLKLNIDGTLEYFNSLEKQVKKRNLYESMTTATSFISNNTDMVMSMYLYKIEEIQVENNLGYRFTFRYRVGGIPVILGSGDEEDFIQMEVFNHSVRSYKHHIRRYMSKTVQNVSFDSKILSSFRVIDMNYEYILKTYLEENNIDIKEGDKVIGDMLASIKDIDLAYFDPCKKSVGEELIPVWVVETQNELYAFDIYKGDLIYQQID